MRTRALGVLSVLLLLAGCSAASPPATLKATLTRTTDLLTWQWTLHNDESEPIVILDGPLSDTTAPQVWVTPGDHDTVEVAYRFLAPPEGVDVARPILQTGHTVAAGQSATGTAQVRLPLAVRH